MLYTVSSSMYFLKLVPNGPDLFITNEELLQDAFSVERRERCYRTMSQYNRDLRSDQTHLFVLD